jgi:hypothetical protein
MNELEILEIESNGETTSYEIVDSRARTSITNIETALSSKLTNVALNSTYEEATKKVKLSLTLTR